ncbi:hypothetical protein [Lysobacter gummosus]|uniref:hypothetical protein n=1 Tax=Lysobacter gummosus TaxID=262324 RepID=UPI0036272812
MDRRSFIRSDASAEIAVRSEAWRRFRSLRSQACRFERDQWSFTSKEISVMPGYSA